MRKYIYSIKIVFAFVFISVAINLVSCTKSDKEKDPYYLMWKNVILREEGHFETLNATYGTYNSEVGLLCRSIEKNDIKARLSVEDRIYLDFFNYDDEIRVIDRLIPNIFVSSWSTSIILRSISSKDIFKLETKTSYKFGCYGIANIVLDNLYVVKNVIITPLSMKFLNSSKLEDDGNLIFVRFYNGNLFKDYIFYGDYVVDNIIKNKYHKIVGAQSLDNIYSYSGVN